MAQDHAEYGWTGLPPWFYGNMVDITYEGATDTMGVGVDMVNGPDGLVIRVYYNVQSPWAFWWSASGIPLVPKHKWWDVFYPNPTGVDGFAPDPSLIGTGPFKFYPADITDPAYYTEGSHIKLDAWKGSGFFTNVMKVGSLGAGVPPQYFYMDNIVDGKDLSLFLGCFKATAPSYALWLGDLGAGVPAKFFNYDGLCDGKDLSLFLRCFKGTAPPYTP
jgi:hypothetical protein